MQRTQISIVAKCNPIKNRLIQAMDALILSCLVLLPAGKTLQAQEASASPYLTAKLNSLNQVPAVLAPSSGRFLARINADDTISFSLTYANMSSAVTQAHIHFGASRTNGGVAVFLCGGKKPACPVWGTVTGVITAADVSRLPVNNGDSVIPQGLTPGDLGGLLEAIRAGDTYVNVHTANFPSGELRGQIEAAGQSAAH